MLKNRIDVHAHYLPPAYREMLKKRNLKTVDGGIKILEWSEENHLKTMEELSISYSCVSISSPHLHMGDAQEAIETARACNEYGSQFANKYPDKIGVMASLPLPEIEASIEEVQYCVEKLNVQGFALMTNSRGVYLGDPLLDPVMEELNKAKAVVFIHPSSPSAVPNNCCDGLPIPFMGFMFDTTRAITNMILHCIFQRYPNIKFIVPHAGAFLPVLSDRLQMINVAYPQFKDVDVNGSLRSLYYDLAGNSMPKQYELLLKTTSEDHLLYGSDCTYTAPQICYKLAEIMDNTLKEKASTIYINNAKKLLDL